MSTEGKGLNKPRTPKADLAKVVGSSQLPQTEIVSKVWEYIKANKLQAKTENGQAEGAGKFIVADEKLLAVFKNTKSTSKAGKLTDLTGMKLGQTINMLQLASVISANLE